MMRSKIPCEIIKDLLPLYIDKLTSEKTSEEVELHLSECDVCKKTYDEMTSNTNEAQEYKGSRLNELPEVDGFKKIRKNNRRKIIVGICTTVIIFTLAICWKTFFYGEPVTCYTPLIAVDGRTAQVSGSFYDSATVYSHYKVKETEKGQEVVIYGAVSSCFNSNGSFQIEIPVEEETININGASINSEGAVISRKANLLYNAKNPYIGNMPANAEISNILGIYNDIGSYKNHLETANEPYSWTLKFEDNWSEAAEEKNNAVMENNAAVILATIDNCSEVKWTYRCGNRQCSKSVSVEDVQKRLGENIKNYAETPEEIQRLIDQLGL